MEIPLGLSRDVVFKKRKSHTLNVASTTREQGRTERRLRDSFGKLVSWQSGMKSSLWGRRRGWVGRLGLQVQIIHLRLSATGIREIAVLAGGVKWTSE